MLLQKYSTFCCLEENFLASRTILICWNTVRPILYLSKPFRLQILNLPKETRSQIFHSVSDNNTPIPAFILKASEAATGVVL